jgi:hypothetical protein
MEQVNRDGNMTTQEEVSNFNAAKKVKTLADLPGVGPAILNKLTGGWLHNA